MNFEKAASSEIRAVATCKKDQPKPRPPSMVLEQKLPKCSTGRTIHIGDDVLATTTNIEGGHDYASVLHTLFGAIPYQKVPPLSFNAVPFKKSCLYVVMYWLLCT